MRLVLPGEERFDVVSVSGAQGGVQGAVKRCFVRDCQQDGEVSGEYARWMRARVRYKQGCLTKVNGRDAIFTQSFEVHCAVCFMFHSEMLCKHLRLCPKVRAFTAWKRILFLKS